MQKERSVPVNNDIFFLSILSAKSQQLLTCTFWRFIIYIVLWGSAFGISSPVVNNLQSKYYRLGTVNSKSFVGKVLLRIKRKFKLTYAL